MSVQPKVKNLIEHEDRGALYCIYPGELQTQNAYIRISREGEITANYDGNVGGGMPINVWNKVDLRISIEPQTDAVALRDWVNDHIDLFQEIHDGHTVDWDETDYKGQLSDRAQRLIDDIEDKIFDEFSEPQKAIPYDADSVTDIEYSQDGYVLDGYETTKDASKFLDEIEKNLDSDWFMDRNSCENALEEIKQNWLEENEEAA